MTIHDMGRGMKSLCSSHRMEPEEYSDHWVRLPTTLLQLTGARQLQLSYRHPEIPQSTPQRTVSGTFIQDLCGSRAHPII
jgi:hypothetical protein